MTSVGRLGQYLHPEQVMPPSRRSASAFVVICGNLVNRVSHAGQIAEFQRIASTLIPSIPLYLAAGNHDVGNEPSKESLHA